MKIQSEGNFVQVIEYVSLYVKNKENYFLQCQLKRLCWYSKSSTVETGYKDTAYKNKSAIRPFFPKNQIILGLL